MPLFQNELDSEVIIDGSVPISGVNNSLPPSAIDRTFAADAENRLSQRDGLNRPRPGIIRRQHTSGGLDSINHLGQGVFLANDASTWWKYDNRANTMATVSGGPAQVSGDQIFATLANATLYFASGGALHKYSIASGFGTVTTLPPNGPTALYPVWEVYRLIYAYQNTLIISDALDPETFDTVTGSLTIDPVASDVITGHTLWQDQLIVVFRNGSTWVVNTGPGLDVPSWQLSRISGTVGCCCHGTIVQTEVDVIFLSETGRGVYKVSQAPASNQQGVWVPCSVDIQDYINRINWTAVDCARATYWNDLYLLSVPLDGASYNNYLLVYSVSLEKWQGTWCLEVAGVDTAVRDFARDRTDPNWTALILATRDGIISRMTYPVDQQNYDQNIDGSQQYFNSSLLSRAFTNMGLRTETYTIGEDITQVRPHSVRFQFLESVDPVNVTVIANRTAEFVKGSVATNNYLLTLTIPAFPFDLDVEGYRNVTLSLLSMGICTEFQFSLQGTGNWVLYQIKTAAFPSMPLIAS